MCVRAAHFVGLQVIGPPTKLEKMISVLKSSAFHANFHRSTGEGGKRQFSSN